MATQGRRPAATGGLDPGIFDELSDADLQGVKAVRRPGVVAPNPYQSPSPGGDGQSRKFGGELASLGKRFLGAFIDQLIYGVAFVIGIVAAVFLASEQGQEPSDEQVMLWIGIACAFILIPAIINAVLITKSGQTIGKKAAGTRIVLDPTRELPGFTKGVLIRSLVTTLLAQFVPFFGLIDIAFIFGEERKCLHDKMAGTIVIAA